MFCYLLRNRVNGKRYIGITRGTVEQRWLVHCKKARLGSKLYIHTAIRKYGPEGQASIRKAVAARCAR